MKSITRRLIIFKKPRKIDNDFFNHYIFVRTFQWTSSEYIVDECIVIEETISHLSCFLKND